MGPGGRSRRPWPLLLGVMLPAVFFLLPPSTYGFRSTHLPRPILRLVEAPVIRPSVAVPPQRSCGFPVYAYTSLQPAACTHLWSTRDGEHSKRRKATILAAAKSLYFPAYVLLAGLLGVTRPQLYAGLSEGFITRALSAVMVLMGMTLSMDDFARIGRSKRAVVLGWCAQFSIMPGMALIMSRVFRLPPHLAAGVILVGEFDGD